MSRRRIGHRYGRRHKELRRHFALRMARGEVFNCWRCGEPITGQWDLGHVGDNTGAGGERWPEHRSCNRATMTNLKARLEEGEGRGPPAGRDERFGGLPDPDPTNDGMFWSRHWYGGFDPRSCAECHRLGGPCEAAQRIEAEVEELVRRSRGVA